MSKSIAISEDTFNKLMEIKNDHLERWNEKQSFDEVIKGLLLDAEYYPEELANKHCLKCCDCESCVEQRNDWREQEAQAQFEKEWD